MKKTSPSWLRHLNPFHFEPKYLFYFVVLNLILSLVLLSYIAVMLFFLPKLHHANHLIETQNEDVSDAQSLHRTIDGDAGILDEVINCVYIIMIPFLGLAAITVINAFYFYKAYRLISDSPGNAPT